MPDASDPRGRGPLDWGDAFAAIPQAAPPADAWSRLAVKLDARDGAIASAAAAAPQAAGSNAATARRHGRRRFARRTGWLGAAAAAALALVAAWPHRDAPPPPAPAHRDAAPIASTAVANASPTLAVDEPKTDATAIALPKAVEAGRKPRFAERKPTRVVAPRTAAGGADGTRAGGEPAQALDALYDESARLEALLALARDDRVASAGAALLAAELEAQVAAIDARLAQPDLDDARRASLWQARVDALRQAAGFESTQRVLASQGNAGALLVSVD